MQPPHLRSRALGALTVFALPLMLGAAGKSKAPTDPVQRAIDVKNALELGPSRLTRAAAMLHAIIRKDPKNANAHRALAWVLLAQGKREAAKAEFEQAKANMKEDDNNFNEVNEALMRMGGGAPAPGAAGAAASPGGAPGGAPAAPNAPPGSPPAGAPGDLNAVPPGGPPPGGDAGVTPPGSDPGAAGTPAPPAGGDPGVPGGSPGASGPGAAGDPGATAASAPPADAGGGGGLPIPLIAAGIGVLALLAVVVKKFIIDKKKAAI